MKIWPKFFFLLVLAVVVTVGGVSLYNYLLSYSDIEDTETGEEQDLAVQREDGLMGSSALNEALDGGEKEIVGGQGPYFHSILFGTADRLDNWTLEEEPIVEHASVPDLIFLEKALGDFPAETLVTYFVDARAMVSGGREQIGMLFSTDSGESWSDLADITIEGVTDDILPVDPSIVRLDDGRLRLYFLDLPTPEESQDSPTRFYSAVSDDAVNFVLEGTVFESDTLITDPDVIYFNHQWLMYYVYGQKVGLAISDDGLSFAAHGLANGLTGIPGAMVVDGQLDVFGCGNQVSYAASSDGETFGARQEAGGLGGDNGNYFYCDPAPVLLDTGAFAIVVKRTTATNINNTAPAGLKRPQEGAVPR